MNKKIKLFLLFFFILLLSANYTYSDTPSYLDFKVVLNQSKAGAGAQKYLKDKFNSEAKKFSDREKKLKKEETELIAQKKLITNEEYQKKVKALRKKVSELNKSKQDSFNKLANQRNKAKAELLKKLNPIIKKYMKDNKINLVIDKNSILLGDMGLDITKPIIELLNKELTTLKIN
mgnify:FL=1